MLSRNYDPAIREVMNRYGSQLANMVADGGGLQDGVQGLVSQIRQYIDASGMFDGLTDEELDDAARFCIDDLFQLGPLEPLLKDETITEIMVNAPDRVLVERGGKIVDSGVHFFDDAHIERIITKIVASDNRRCDSSSPMCDCKLRRRGASFDGSRVNAVWRPIAVDHPTLDIRKFRNDLLTPEALIGMDTMDEKIADFLRALVEARMNIIISGGTGSGKTTLLNAVSNFIPNDQRIITIEDTAELNLAKDHVIRLEGRQANSEGAGLITIRQLVRNTLRMRPDRIVVGECRGASPSTCSRPWAPAMTAP